MKYCTHCGKPNDDNAKFCKYCGAVSDEVINPKARSDKRAGNHKKIIIVITVIIILIVGFVIYLYKLGGTASLIKDNLMNEDWEVYYAYNSYDEELIAPQLFGNGVSYMNRLSFYEDGRFELTLSSYTNNYSDGIMTGTYECNGTVVTLKPELSDEVIELNYKKLEQEHDDVDGLCWNVHMMDLYGNEDDYRIYFSSQTFFQ